MDKKVKVTVTGLPITSISAPLTMGTYGPVVFSTDDIFKCIVAGAKVVEVLDSKEVVLTLSNYNKDNGTAVAPVPVVEEVKEVTPVEEVVPVVEEPVATEEIIENATEEVAEGTESPEHWLPPQREVDGSAQQPRSNSNRNRNNSKKK